MTNLGSLEPPVADYLREVAARARSRLGARLVGVYAGGSVGLGAFDRRRSDLDVAVVVDGRLDDPQVDALVAALRHDAIPCPARGLELVVYRRDAAASRDVAADFELNLNTGRRMPRRIDVTPEVGDPHWFAIDRSILREHGLAIAGPPASEVFGDIPADALLPLVAAAVRWHLDGGAATEDAILNACRALRFAIEGRWSSKVDAGRWATDLVPQPDVVAAALEACAGGSSPSREAADGLVRFVLDELERRVDRAEVSRLYPRARRRRRPTRTPRSSH